MQLLDCLELVVGRNFALALDGQFKGFGCLGVPVGIGHIRYVDYMMFETDSVAHSLC